MAQVTRARSPAPCAGRYDTTARPAAAAALVATWVKSQGPTLEGPRSTVTDEMFVWGSLQFQFTPTGTLGASARRWVPITAPRPTNVRRGGLPSYSAPFEVAVTLAPMALVARTEAYTVMPSRMPLRLLTIEALLGVPLSARHPSPRVACPGIVDQPTS